ncbi:solute carrier organic anion transporter family member 74D-like [Ornithodoros turicata]|uniref:solute carrier organic anion transporter family member 74D-like n=1 Tax=Ornithodoros turicata TaxID=34597 RepID=UPI00313978D4
MPSSSTAKRQSTSSRTSSAPRGQLLWLRFFHTPACYMICFSALGILQGCYYSYLIGINTTLERRFAYRSLTAGLIFFADNFGPIVLGAMIGMYSSKRHRPRWVGVAAVLLGLSCILAAMPYFIFGKADEAFSMTDPTVESDVNHFCHDGTEDRLHREENCLKSRKKETLPAVLFLVSCNFLTGIGTAVYYSAGTAYLQDMVKKKNSAMYMAFLTVVRGLGPCLGFVFAALILAVYEDPFYDPGFKDEDPRWIGAWWLGFAILGFLQLLFAIPLFFFPRRIANEDDPLGDAEEQPMTFREAFDATKRIVRNPLLVCQTFAHVFKWFGVLGFCTYVPKYIQEHFQQSPSTAALLSGTFPIACSLVATLAGGFLIKSFKPSPRILTAVIFVTELITALIFASLMAFSCPQPQLTERGVLESRLDLVNSCNVNCSCSVEVFQPVCEGKTTYFSPCFAGCYARNINGTVQHGSYYNCKCVDAFDDDGVERRATDGFCQSDCPFLAFYIMLLCIAYGFSFSTKAGQILIPLRCVEERDKAFALGFAEGVLALFSFLPYPLVYGSMVDANCVVWEESCGYQGNCWAYDMKKFNYSLHGVTFILLMVGVALNFVVFLLSGRIKSLYGRDKSLAARTRGGDSVQGSSTRGSRRGSIRKLTRNEIFHMVSTEDPDEEYADTLDDPDSSKSPQF